MEFSEQLKKVGTFFKFDDKSEFGGLEIFESEEGYKYNLVILKRDAGNIEIVKIIRDASDISIIEKDLTAEITVQLIYNIKGVIYKKLPEGSSTDYSRLFPQFDLENFYLQKHDQFLSVTRKSPLIKVINLLTDSKILVKDITVGAFDLKYTLPIIKSNHVALLSHVFHFNEEKTERIEKNDSLDEQIYQLDNQAISSHLLPAYGAALKGLILQKSTSDIPDISLNYEKHLQKRKLKRRLSTILPIFILFILLNSFAQSFIEKKNTAIKFQTQSYFESKSQIDSLQNLNKERALLFSKLNINKHSKASFWADRIASTIPQEIALVEMVISPQVEDKKQNYYSAKENSEIHEYHSNIVHLKGHSVSPSIYSTWLEKLKGQEWVSNVEHLNYELNSEGKGDFEITISVL